MKHEIEESESLSDERKGKVDALRSVMHRQVELMKELVEADKSLARLCSEIAGMKIDGE